METVNLHITSYYWSCLVCKVRNDEMEETDTVECINCETEFSTEVIF